MSALLFNPNVEFDFAKKPNKTKYFSKLVSIFLFGIFFIVCFFGFVIHGKIQNKIPLNKTNSALSNQYTSNKQNINLNKLVIGKDPISSSAILPNVPAANITSNVPILMYHYTPSNFEEQLQYLQSQGYIAITMAELGNHLYLGNALPSKPVVITFDDGYLDQLNAYELLKKYNMKATFYLILGGEKSNHCIGLNRTNLSCGDTYLSFSQVKMLIDSGLIEVGAHTLNHADLPTLSTEQQYEEISESKSRLENIYNIEITSLAYPYGKYNQISIDNAAKAGFLTAVTTQAGTLQSTAGRYTLTRIRNALLLP